jgi:ubiquinol-cytochrome c reductase cytochrome c1 subunit
MMRGTMMSQILRRLAAALLALGIQGTALAEGGAKHPHGPEAGWSFDGPLGKIDMASVQRGYQIYREVCSACHSMDLLAFRNLGEPSGPYYEKGVSPGDNPQVKAFAAEYTIEYINDDGDLVERPRNSADRFRNPYPNPQIARLANGGALPPDLSVITKARAGGPDYIYSLLTGYPEDPEYDGIFEISDAEHPEAGGTLTQPVGLYYNPYFPGDTKPNWEGDPRHAPYGGFLAMGPQLLEGRVEYLDGTPATVSQMAKDVTTFLHWAADPKAQLRKEMGLAAIIFLTVLAVLLWFSYRRIWRNVEH